MKATVSDLEKYAACPKLYEQRIKLEDIEDFSKKDFTELVTTLFRRDMETGEKQNWKYLEKKWEKIFFARFDNSNEENLKAYNRSLVALQKFYKWYLSQSLDVVAVNYTLGADIYVHHLIAEVPVVLVSRDKAILIFTELLDNLQTVLVNPKVRYASMALGEVLGISEICNIGFMSYKTFHFESFIPNDRYFESAMIDFLGLMQSMHTGISYPNTMYCSICPILRTCEVMKGNV